LRLKTNDVGNALFVTGIDGSAVERITSQAGRGNSFLRAVGLAAMLALFAAPIVRADTTIFADPFEGSSGDQLDRGFYLSSYPGTNLSTVSLEYLVDTPGSYTTSLTVRLGTYDGAIVGTTQTVTTNLGVNDTLVTYNFGGAPIPLGSVVTFTQQVVSGPTNVVFYDTGVSGVSGITQTNETVPPLDTFRRDSVGVIITATSLPGTPVPSSLLLLLVGLACVGVFYSTKKNWLRA
jgi:hypothetical protein